MHDPARQLAPDLTDPAPPGRIAPSPADERAEGSAEPHRPGRFPWITPFRVALVVVVLAAAILTLLLTGGSGPAYRTVVVGTGTAVSTLDSVAVVTPVDKADLAFDVSGTVGSVDVAVGQQVAAGQVVASLDTTDLQAQVVSAQAAVASAQLTLAKDQASETSTTSTATPSGGGTSTGAAAAGTAAPAASSSGHGSSDQQIESLQATLLADQQQQDADAAAAQAALRAATTACATTASAAASTSPAPSFRPPTTPPTTAPGSGGEGAALTCSAALSAASAAQTRLSTDIKTVEKDESALNSALGGSSSSTGSGGAGSGHGGSASGATAATTPTSSAADATASSGSGAAPASTASAAPGASGSNGAKNKPATATQLAVDQASIDAAQANLDDAQSALGDADLVSTISGTVASVSVAPGGSVSSSAGSASPAFVVIGSGTSYEAMADVPVTHIGAVSVGQRAVVTPDSTNRGIDGTVTAIGILGSTSSTTTTYPVTVTLDSSDLGQFSGSEAEVSVVTGTSPDDAVTVPSSALRTVGSRHLATVLEPDGTTKSVPVTLGTVGDLLTQVTSGLTKGEVVVLADFAAEVPSSSTTAGRFGLGGGTFGGGRGLAGAGGLGVSGGTAVGAKG